MDDEGRDIFKCLNDGWNSLGTRLPERGLAAASVFIKWSVCIFSSTDAFQYALNARTNKVSLQGLLCNSQLKIRRRADSAISTIRHQNPSSLHSMCLTFTFSLLPIPPSCHGHTTEGFHDIRSKLSQFIPEIRISVCQVTRSSHVFKYRHFNESLEKNPFAPSIS